MAQAQVSVSNHLSDMRNLDSRASLALYNEPQQAFLPVELRNIIYI